MRYPESRFERRLAARRAAAGRSDPGVRFGAQDPRSGEDRRTQERRKASPEETEKALRALGMEDRRRSSRRKGDGDRRR